MWISYLAKFLEENAVILTLKATLEEDIINTSLYILSDTAESNSDSYSWLAVLFHLSKVISDRIFDR
jgi:hypothetical protein